MEGLCGVYTILTTPFTLDGSLDETSLRRLVEEVIKAGVDGITVLGVAGEAQKLTTAERERVIQVVLEVNQRRLPIFVGTSHEGTDAAVAASQRAEAMGASGVMVAPPTFLQPGSALTEHYRHVGEAVRGALILQDYPPVNGVTLSPRALADLCEGARSITTIKLEGLPTPQRVAQTHALIPAGVTILGGLGGVYLLDELRRGASGTMTGFGYPEVLVRIWRSWRLGDRQAAREIYYRYLPLLVFEGQPGIGLAIRKEILRYRGFIQHATIRQPGPRLDDGVVSDLVETLQALDLYDVMDAEVPR